MVRYRNLVSGCALVLSFGWAVSGIANGQASPASQTPKTLIRITTNEVTVTVTVTDRHGNLVLDLTPGDFHVFDNGVEQKIDHWELGGDPLAVALVIDTSSRLYSMASAIHSLGIIFTDTVMALDSEAAVITYNSSVTERQKFTMNRDAVEKTIKTAKFDGSGEADLYDGMASGVRLLQTAPRKWHRVLLVIGESQDTHSTARLDQVVRDAERADVSIYVLGLSSVSADLRAGALRPNPLRIAGLPPISAAGCSTTLARYGDSQCFNLATPALWLLERGISAIKHHRLEVTAAATGGMDYTALRESGLQSALDKIGSELHAQYILGYQPKSGAAPGFHIIRVTVSRRNVTVRARPGYYLVKR